MARKRHQTVSDMIRIFTEKGLNADKVNPIREVIRQEADEAGIPRTSVSMSGVMKAVYYLSVAGDAWNRTVESVKFYLALRRAGLPVYMYKAKILAERLTEKEKIGIVPDGIMSDYCESFFPNEEIIDFINLPFENRDNHAKYCVWRKDKEIKLI